MLGSHRETSYETTGDIHHENDPNYALIIIAALAVASCAGTPNQASTGEYIDDTAITAKVKTALMNDPAVSGLAINVETYKGTVQLSGFSTSMQEKRRAEELASSVPGVQAVQNHIQLNRTFQRSMEK